MLCVLSLILGFVITYSFFVLPAKQLGVTRIICVGDSITNGAGASDYDAKFTTIL